MSNPYPYNITYIVVVKMEMVSFALAHALCQRGYIDGSRGEKKREENVLMMRDG